MQNRGIWLGGMGQTLNWDWGMGLCRSHIFDMKEPSASSYSINLCFQPVKHVESLLCPSVDERAHSASPFSTPECRRRQAAVRQKANGQRVKQSPFNSYKSCNNMWSKATESAGLKETVWHSHEHKANAAMFSKKCFTFLHCRGLPVCYCIMHLLPQPSALHQRRQDVLPAAEGHLCGAFMCHFVFSDAGDMRGPILIFY